MDDVAGDFFRDLQKEVEGWQNDRSSSEAPKSLWEEMAVSDTFPESFARMTIIEG